MGAAATFTETARAARADRQGPAPPDRDRHPIVRDLEPCLGQASEQVVVRRQLTFFGQVEEGAYARVEQRLDFGRALRGLLIPAYSPASSNPSTTQYEFGIGLSISPLSDDLRASSVAVQRSLEGVDLRQLRTPALGNACRAVIRAGDLPYTAPVVSASSPRFTARRAPCSNDVLFANAHNAAARRHRVDDVG